MGTAFMDELAQYNRGHDDHVAYAVVGDKSDCCVLLFDNYNSNEGARKYLVCFNTQATVAKGVPPDCNLTQVQSFDTPHEMIEWLRWALSLGMVVNGHTFHMLMIDALHGWRQGWLRYGATFPEAPSPTSPPHEASSSPSS